MYADLAENPSKGTERPEIKKGYYSNFIASHTIYYCMNGTQIGIIDILHQAMEPKLHIH
ncbi:type II toxin-antitoxin system RelE/ParE family toxin [Bathymodiolus heckerae thiotrophic gill symbiont]|uniref:type II toxin-antitoxin system RelE/ParE family toxin n=1 Tax=Bathymodiolus heckerae thiotrophic gill symbiont TaxID=1052212 RepID=UPI00201829C1|nr:type II toxin-antitoxin system RelE/ParE family toxin [Bathymodiolus heckerae thiotrophic gill symbiont]